MTATLRMYLVTGALAATAALVWLGVAHIRNDAVNDLRLKQTAAVVDSLDAALKGQRATVVRDTVRLTRFVTRWDSVYTPIHDTFTVNRVDTVRVPVSTLALADSTIKACRVAVSDCAKLAATERLRGDNLAGEVKILRQQMPSRAGNALRGVLWAGVGFAVGHFTR